jgi:hypothetical protein
MKLETKHEAQIQLVPPLAMRSLGCRDVTLTTFNMYNTIRKNLKSCN